MTIIQPVFRLKWAMKGIKSYKSIAEKYVLFLFLLFSAHFIQSQNVQVSGNEIIISLDDNNQTPKTEDGTLFEGTPISRSRTHTFTIYNSSSQKAHVEKITFDNSEFKTEGNGRLRDIKAGESKNFDITFEPNPTLGFKYAQVSIFVGRGRNSQIFTFKIEGSAIEYNENETSIMISQYYNSQNKTQIEVKNMSEFDIEDKEFFLAYFKPSDNLNQEPKKGQTIEIGKMAVGDVLLYKIKGNLNGNEVFVISTDKKKKCYEERVDIIGSQTNWGKDVSMTKGGCASEIPHIDYDIKDWLVLAPLEVDIASDLQNIDLGTYFNGSITWTGNEWTNGGLPDRSRTVIIDGDYKTFMGDIEACDLTVRAELNFRKPYGGSETNSVIVHRNLEVSDTGKFKLGNQMSLVMYDDEAQITGEIIKYENSTKLNNPYDFTYWSSPVKDATVENVFSGVRAGRVYYFDQSKTTVSDPDNDPEGTYWNVWVRANGVMKPGRGYASEASLESANKHKIMFKGQPNNGVIYEQVHYNNDQDDDNDWNLIGNPYPSAINIDAFFDANSQVIDPVIYLWTHSTPISEESGDYSSNDYASYNKTGGTGVDNGPVPSYNIGSSQAFMVRSIAADEVIFNNSMRLKNENDQFFKSSIVKKKNKENEKDRIWLNLKTDQGGFNQLLIGFIEGATSNYDSGYDALKNQSANKIGFYSLLEEKKLVIQGLGLSDLNSSIPLGFDTRVDNRVYAVSIGNTEGKLKRAKIILQDHLLGISHNLKEGDYTFTQDKKGTFPNRFSLNLSPQITNVDSNTSAQENIVVYNEGDIFTVEASKGVDTFLMYDVQGRMILKHHPKEKEFKVNNRKSKSGEVLYLQIIHRDQSIVRKKVYKH